MKSFSAIVPGTEIISHLQENNRLKKVIRNTNKVTECPYNGVMQQWGD